MKQGKLIIISAPSGAGKTTVVKHLMKAGMNLAFSVSATCRLPRRGERDGVDYYFMSHMEFMRRVNNDEFVEWEEVYEGICYGTLKSEVERISGEGRTVLFDVDVIGGLNIKRIYGDRALALFIEAPSVEELRRRLVARNTDAADVIEKRVAKAEYEMQQASRFDAVVVNSEIVQACSDAEHIIGSFIDG